MCGIEIKPEKQVNKNTDKIKEVTSPIVKENGIKKVEEPIEKPFDREMVSLNAQKLKRQADKINGPAQYLLYLKAGLKFVQVCCSFLSDENISKSEIKQAKSQFLSTAQFMRACGVKCIDFANITGKKAEGQIEHIGVLILKISSICYMEFFSLNKKNVHFFINERNKQRKRMKIIQNHSELKETHVDFVYEVSETAILSLRLWDQAVEYEKESYCALLKNNKTDKLDKLRSLSLQLYDSQRDLKQIVTKISKYLSAVY